VDRYRGNKRSKVWLIGDSAPEQWEDNLLHPFDEKHPIIHNIWTPIIYKIQKKYYLKYRKLLDDNNLFVINAVKKSITKPKGNLINWDGNFELTKSVTRMNEAINEYKPELIITFGAFSYEFMRRSLNIEPKFRYNHWGAKELGTEFLNQIKCNKIIPLLHRSIAGGHFIKSHQYFTNSTKENYFEFVAERLFERIGKSLTTPLT
jgi:hypothetical protein